MRDITWLRVLGSRVLALFRKRRHDVELQDEIQTHLDLLTEERVRQGMTLREARAAARREFGGVEQTKETYRDQRGFPFVEALAQDARFALRALRKNPGFAAIVLLSLSLGIGANTAIFSVLNAAILRPLPVANPGELFVINQQAQDSVSPRFSYPLFDQLRSATPRAAEVAAMSRVASMRARVDGASASERLSVQLVSGEYFSVLRLAPAQGRALTPDDNRTLGGHPVTVISNSLWRRRFGAAADVVGRGVTLNDTAFTIVGVAPPEFSGVWLESPVDAWIPLMMQSQVGYLQDVSFHNADMNQPFVPQEGIEWVRVFGRAPRNASGVVAALDVAFRQGMAHFADQYSDPATKRSFTSRHLTFEALDRGLSTVRPRLVTPIVALLGTVFLILLIACANAANLLLARAEARRREIAIRLSIGASRGRLMQQLLTESAILVGAATGLGVLFSYWMAGELVQRMASGLGATPFLVGMDMRVTGFTAVVSILTGVLFGVMPAVRASRSDLSTALKADSRTGRVGGRLSAPTVLVVLQVALSLVLVVGAGLFARSLRNLTHLDLGFEPDQFVSVAVNPRAAHYPLTSLPELYGRLVERVEATPGVRSAVMSTCQLAAGCHDTGSITIAGYVPSPGESPRLDVNHVGPHFFSTVGMRLMQGRDFDSRDNEQAPNVAIVNQTMARRYFPNGDAVGQHFGWARPDMEIIGIVQDARVAAVRDEPVPMAYFPLAQDTRHYAGALNVRASGNADQLVAMMNRVVADVDPNLPVDSVRTMSAQIDRNVRVEQLVAVLTSLFGVLALGLASFGLFGVMSYAVSRRTSEFGIRMALGAPPASVLWAVFRESLTLVALGLAVGVPVVLVASGPLADVLFRIRPNDPMTLVGAIGLLVVVAAAAAFFPAWRASQVDPMIALRSE